MRHFTVKEVFPISLVDGTCLADVYPKDIQGEIKELIWKQEKLIIRQWQSITNILKPYNNMHIGNFINTIGHLTYICVGPAGSHEEEDSHWCNIFIPY